jgi:NAD-dependent SIR2 family protein deacetylase
MHFLESPALQISNSPEDKKKADLVLVLGTSLQVAPVSSIRPFVSAPKGKPTTSLASTGYLC